MLCVQLPKRRDKDRFVILRIERNSLNRKNDAHKTTINKSQKSKNQHPNPNILGFCEFLWIVGILLGFGVGLLGFWVPTPIRWRCASSTAVSDNVHLILFTPKGVFFCINLVNKSATLS